MASSGWLPADWPAPPGVHAGTTLRDGEAGVSPPPLRPAIYRPLPEAGVAPATLLSWGPAKDPPVSAAE